MSESPEIIEEQLHLEVPQSRVWRAIADSQEFSSWFGVAIDGPWVVGAPMRGRFEHAVSQAAIDGALVRLGLPPSPIASVMPDEFCVVETIEPEHTFRYRWIPYGVDAGIDPATEPRTTVEFRLVADGAGTRLSVTEAGFGRVPAARRRRAFLMNQAGWAAQLRNIAKHLNSDTPS